MKRSLKFGLFAFVAVAATGGGVRWFTHHRDGDGGGAQPMSANRQVTFHRDVAPILYNNCATCHRPGEAGPFTLLSYDDARRRAKRIVDVTGARIMPPWMPEPGHGEFADERRLSNEHIDVLRRWAEQGCPEGEPATGPKPPSWPDGWQLGKPDLVVTLAQPYAFRADGSDLYRNFVLPVPRDAVGSGRWVKTVEMRPGNPQVVHHAFLMIDRTSASRDLDALDPEPGFDGMDMGEGARDTGGQFNAWNPGKSPPAPREGVAWRLHPGTDLVVQAHMRPTGKPELVQPAMGLFFTDSPPTEEILKVRLNDLTIDIPAGATHHVVRDVFALPVDVDVLAIKPHAHYLCRDMRGEATLPDGTKRSLLWIKEWDFNWQDEYRYKQPMRLPRGTKLEMRFTYDNSAANPRNPNDPPRRVRYGPQSADEMAELAFLLRPVPPSGAAALGHAVVRKRMDAILARFDKALAEDPNDVMALMGNGKALLILGRPLDASGYFAKATTLRPTDPEAHDFLGRARLSARNVAGARAAFEQAIAVDPKFSKSHNNLGLIDLQAGDYPAAAARFRAAIQLDANDSIAHANLGAALFNQSDFAAAVAEFQEALRIDPETPGAAENLHNALAKLPPPP